MALRKLVVRDVIELRNMTWTEKAVRALIQFRQTGRGWADWSIDAMAEELGIARRSFIRATETLEAAGWLEIERSRGRKNRYRTRSPEQARQLSFRDAPRPARPRPPDPPTPHTPETRHGPPVDSAGLPDDSADDSSGARSMPKPAEAPPPTHANMALPQRPDGAPTHANLALVPVPTRHYTSANLALLRTRNPPANHHRNGT